MEIILRQAVENLGKTGDVVKVKSGYARNYLLPHGLAYEATPGNLKRIKQERDRLEAAENERRTAAQTPRKARAGVAHLLGARRRRGQAVRLRHGGRHCSAARGAGLPHREAPDRPARADQGARRLSRADSPARRREA